MCQLMAHMVAYQSVHRPCWSTAHSRACQFWGFWVVSSWCHSQLAHMPVRWQGPVERTDFKSKTNNMASWMFKILALFLKNLFFISWDNTIVPPPPLKPNYKREENSSQHQPQPQGREQGVSAAVHLPCQYLNQCRGLWRSPVVVECLQ